MTHPSWSPPLKIRSITRFHPDAEEFLRAPAAVAAPLAELREAMETEGLPVQTLRLAFPPLATQFSVDDPRLLDRVREIEAAAVGAGLEYLSLGPLRPEDDPAWATRLVEILAHTERVFVTTAYATEEHGVSVDLARAAARIIVEAAPLETNGFANLRFAALARVPAGVPFLPAAYAAERSHSFALAIEGADLARRAFDGADDADSAVAALRQGIEEAARRIEAICREASARHALHFGGSDFSPAPFPADELSATAALESLGLDHLGQPGTVSAAALLTTAVQGARFEKAGFCGLFLPVLEDDRLAKRASEGHIGLGDLLLASTVCGTGLDTVPLPGDVSAEDLLPWLLDLGSIALRLRKPLTARLMPMPGRSAGDELEFDFPFFANGRVMEIPRTPLGGILARSHRIPIEGR